MSGRLTSIGVVCFVLAWAMPAVAQDSDAERFWGQWRGPDANGVARYGNPPTEWSETKNIRWKVEIPGRGRPRRRTATLCSLPGMFQRLTQVFWRLSGRISRCRRNRSTFGGKLASEKPGQPAPSQMSFSNKVTASGTSQFHRAMTTRPITTRPTCAAARSASGSNATTRRTSRSPKPR